MSDTTKKDETATVETVVAAEAAVAAAPAPAFPTVPDDDSFLQVLNTSGSKRFDNVAAMSGIKAYLASRAGLYDLPNKIKVKMESTANALREPISEADIDTFEELYSLISEKKYADALAAIGMKGASRFMNQERREALLSGIQQLLIPAIVRFHNTLASYRETLRASMSENVTLGLLAGGMNTIPDDVKALVMDVPSTDMIKVAAESFVNTGNEAYAGWGVAVARVLASDALRLRKVLEKPELPRFTGYLTKEQMLMGLGINVTSEDVQLERNLSQYALAIIQLNEGLDAANEMKFIRLLAQLDNAISWDNFGVSAPAKSYSAKSSGIRF